MSKPRIIEVPYHEFARMLRQATDSGKKIEKSDKEAWSSYVKRHTIPEAGMGVHARAGALSGKTQSVIIDGAGESDGYYMYSSGDLFCLKYELGRE